MAVTKQNIIDSIKYEIKKLKYNRHPAIIEDAINDAYNQLMSDLAKQHIKGFELYTKEYEVAISLDASSNRYYSDLPVSVINIQRPQGGVIGINAKDGTGFKFFPTTAHEQRLVENIEAGLYGRFYGYYVNHDQVFYVGMTANVATAGVRMTLAPQFKEFAATDMINLPAGWNYNLKQLVVDYITNREIIDLQIEQND